MVPSVPTTAPSVLLMGLSSCKMSVQDLTHHLAHALSVLSFCSALLLILFLFLPCFCWPMMFILRFCQKTHQKAEDEGLDRWGFGSASLGGTPSFPAYCPKPLENKHFHVVSEQHWVVQSSQIQTPKPPCSAISTYKMVCWSGTKKQAKEEVVGTDVPRTSGSFGGHPWAKKSSVRA